VTYGCADGIGYFQILRPDDLSDPSNTITNDNASASNKNDLCVSVFRFDKIYCFLESP
jgi:hypothetical protein